MQRLEGSCEEQRVDKKLSIRNAKRKKTFLKTQSGVLQSKDEAKFILCIVLPMSALVSVLSWFPESFSAIRNPTFSQISVSESLHHPLVAKSNGKEVKVVISWKQCGLGKLIGKILSPFIIALSGRK